MKKICIINGCSNPINVKKHGLCMAHVKRYYRGEKVEGRVRSRRSYLPYMGK